MNYDSHNFTFQQVDVSWSLQDSDPLLWGQLGVLDPVAIEAVLSMSLRSQVLASKNLNSYDTDSVIRPKGSRRAFYVKLNSGGVLAIKGTEITSPCFAAALKDDKLEKLSNRPWTMFENFLFHEQKLPLAVSLDEASRENIAAIKFQKSMIRAFGHFELAPIPLFTYKWPANVVSDYAAELLPTLNERAKNLAEMLMDRESLGASVYYYPHVPHRIRFVLPKNVDSFAARLNEFSANPIDGVVFQPALAAEKVLDIATKMLMAGFFPFSFHDHGVGQCIAPQNVTVLGGITDMGSLLPFEDIQNDREFYELFFSMIVVLTATVRECFLSPLPDLKYEFSDPSVTSIYISNFVWQHMRDSFESHKSKIGIKVDPRVIDLLKASKCMDPMRLFAEIYPSRSK